MFKTNFDKITPREILDQAGEYFRLIQALFEEMQKRIDPLEAANRALGSELIDAKADVEQLNASVGNLRDRNAELLLALGAAAAKHPELKEAFERAKQRESE